MASEEKCHGCRSQTQSCRKSKADLTGGHGNLFCSTVALVGRIFSPCFAFIFLETFVVAKNPPADMGTLALPGWLACDANPTLSQCPCTVSAPSHAIRLSCSEK